MNNIALKLIISFLLLHFTQSLLSSETNGHCKLITRPVTSSCYSSEVYAGVAKAREHGGTCIKTVGQCSIQSYPTKSKYCSSNFKYVGPNKPNVHGGSCISLKSLDENEYSLETRYISYDYQKVCKGGGGYVGPVKVSEHGGYCI